MSPDETRSLYHVALYHLRTERFDRSLPGVECRGAWIPFDQRAMTANAHRVMRELKIPPIRTWPQEWRNVGDWSLDDLQHFVDHCERDLGCAPPEPPRFVPGPIITARRSPQA